MKKYFKISYIGIFALMITLVSCEDFLYRPLEDNYTIDGFYQTDDQCFQAANFLYSSPWHDYHRGFFKIGDGMAGNFYMGIDNEYQTISVTSSNEDLINASNSLWLVNGHANAIIDNIKKRAGSKVSEQTKNTVIGEAMVWKAMAYFYLVRGWGAVPIIHNNSTVLGDGNANSLKKNHIEDVYEYITRTLTKASELLPAANQPGRINKYSAYGLLAKVYLTRSGLGQSGQRKQEHLDKAKEYAAKVINESGASLEPVYANLFRISTGNFNSENLISWQWVVAGPWTASSYMQSDLAPGGNFSGNGDGWGQYTGPTVDLQKLFNEDPREARQNIDVRRKATMMMKDDFYPNFWRHAGGFTATFDNDNNVAGAAFESPTGAQNVKHLVGHYLDHQAEAGVPSQAMKYSLATHLLRLADVYLIYTESVIGNSGTTSDALALQVYNAVKRRADKNWVDATSVTFNDIFDERRRELALEGDNWFDYVRLSYYDPTMALQKINNQERGYFKAAELKEYYKGTRDKAAIEFTSFKLNITSVDKFRIPFPDTDLSKNPNLMDGVESVPFDFSTIEY